MHVITQQFMKEMESAIEMFGSYSFDDKGPREVMDINTMADQLKNLDPEQAAMIIIELAEQGSEGDRPEAVARALAEELQEWDELFAVPDMAVWY